PARRHPWRLSRPRECPSSWGAQPSGATTSAPCGSAPTAGPRRGRACSACSRSFPLVPAGGRWTPGGRPPPKRAGTWPTPPGCWNGSPDQVERREAAAAAAPPARPMTPRPANEDSRLAALRAYAVREASPADDRLGDLVDVAATVCEVPIAYLSFIDADTQW